MQRTKNSSHRLFLFNLSHQDFIEGQEDTLATAVTRKRAVRQYVYLMFVLAFPMIVIITGLVAVAGYQIELLLFVELITALLACAYFVLKRYLKDRELRYEGRIIYGEIIRRDALPGYASIGTSHVTRIFYRFINPDNERVIASIDLSYMWQRLPDGRKYPKEGTPIAILYANEKNHKLL